MKAVLAIFQRELKAYFLAPLAWVVLFGFLVVNGFVFSAIVGYLSNPTAPPSQPLVFFFGGTIYFWMVLLFVAPVITMRLLAEERKTGSIEVLMTAPVTEEQVVVGKYVAALAFYCFLWLPTAAYAGIVAYHAEVDWGPILAGYLGILGIGALFLSMGMLASAVTRSQIVAAILTFALVIVVFSFGLLEGLIEQPVLKEAFGYLNLWQHMDEFSKGIVDTRRLVYYLSATLFFLFLSSRALDNNKWS